MVKGSKFSIRRVVGGPTYEIEFRWTVSRKPDTQGQPVCTAFVNGSKVGAAMGGGYDLMRTALTGWLETQVQPDDYGDWVTWEQADGPIAMAVLTSVQKRDETHTLPRISTGRPLWSLVQQLGFEVTAGAA